MFDNLDKFLMLVELFRLFMPEGKNKDIEEFKKWLELHKHDSLVEVLNNQNQLANYLEVLIKDSSGKLEEQLKDINKMVSSIYARTEAFAPVAERFGVYSDLSEQAIDILRHFVDSNSETIIALETYEGITLVFDHDNMIPKEQRFLEADMDELVRCGFLSENYNSQGNPVYKLKRTAVNLINSLPKEDK